LTFQQLHGPLLAHACRVLSYSEADALAVLDAAMPVCCPSSTLEGLRTCVARSLPDNAKQQVGHCMDESGQPIRWQIIGKSSQGYAIKKIKTRMWMIFVLRSIPLACCLTLCLLQL
jgi:hypothetical protein